MADRAKAATEYTVTACLPSNLSGQELAICVAIIKSGGAVAVDVAKLRAAKCLAVARKGSEIVAVATIKRVRADYASSIAVKSRFPFSVQMRELGYVAVAQSHGNKGLSGKLVGALLAVEQGSLFATTYDQYMKRTLATAGFEKKGDEWRGRKHMLSLWIKR